MSSEFRSFDLRPRQVQICGAVIELALQRYEEMQQRTLFAQCRGHMNGTVYRINPEGDFLIGTTVRKATQTRAAEKRFTEIGFNEVSQIDGVWDLHAEQEVRTVRGRRVTKGEHEAPTKPNRKHAAFDGTEWSVRRFRDRVELPDEVPNHERWVDDRLTEQEYESMVRVAQDANLIEEVVQSGAYLDRPYELPWHAEAVAYTRFGREEADKLHHLFHPFDGPEGDEWGFATIFPRLTEECRRTSADIAHLAILGTPKLLDEVHTSARPAVGPPPQYL